MACVSHLILISGFCNDIKAQKRTLDIDGRLSPAHQQTQSDHAHGPTKVLTDKHCQTTLVVLQKCHQTLLTICVVNATGLLDTSDLCGDDDGVELAGFHSTVSLRLVLNSDLGPVIRTQAPRLTALCARL